RRRSASPGTSWRACRKSRSPTGSCRWPSPISSVASRSGSTRPRRWRTSWWASRSRGSGSITPTRSKRAWRRSGRRTSAGWRAAISCPRRSTSSRSATSPPRTRPGRPRRMPARGRIAGLVLLACAARSAVAAAVSFALTEREQAEAIHVGERSVTAETFGSEWVQSTGAGEVTVMTPFHRLALAARQAAFRQNTMKPADVEKLLREDRGRLVFWVSLRGPRGGVGRGVVATAEALLFRGSTLVGEWFTPVVWTGYVLFADALVARVTGRSFLTTDRAELVGVVLTSIGCWWLFEWYNAPRFWRGGQDTAGLWWQYHNLEPNPFLRRVGYDWAFATIFPALFLTARILAATLFAGFRVAPVKPPRWALSLSIAAGVVAVALPL